MALRLRKDKKTLVCAAFGDPMEGDVYLDDAVHYWLWENGLVFTEDEGDTWKVVGNNRK